MTVSDLEEKLREAVKVPHEPINARLIANLQSENEMLKITNRVLEREVTELKEAKEAPTLKAAAIEALKDIEELEKPIYATQGEKELIKTDANGREIDPIDELEKASYKRIEEKGLIYTTTKQVFDKDVFIKKVKERENEHQKLHQEKNGIIKALKAVKERTETALKSVFGKFTGKSIGEVQKEREGLNLSNTDKIRGFVDQLNKEQEKPKSRGMER